MGRIIADCTPAASSLTRLNRDSLGLDRGYIYIYTYIYIYSCIFTSYPAKLANPKAITKTMAAFRNHGCSAWGFIWGFDV